MALMRSFILCFFYDYSKAQQKLRACYAPSSDGESYKVRICVFKTVTRTSFKLIKRSRLPVKEPHYKLTEFSLHDVKSTCAADEKFWVSANFLWKITNEMNSLRCFVRTENVGSLNGVWNNTNGLFTNWKHNFNKTETMSVNVKQYNRHRQNLA